MKARELNDDVLIFAGATADMSSKDVLHEVMDKLNAERKSMKELGWAKFRFPLHIHQDRDNWRLEHAPPGC